MFSNAAVVMMRKELEFWMSAETQDPAGSLRDLRPRAVDGCDGGLRSGSVTPARDRLRLLEPPDGNRGGHTGLSGARHTPGHAAVLVSSGKTANCSTWATR